MVFNYGRITMKEMLIMNDKERQRMKIMARLQERSLNQTVAAKQLKISVRQVKRLYKVYCTQGDGGLVSKQRGVISNSSLSIELKDKVAALIKQNYPDFGPTFAHEKLVEIHDLNVSVSTVRNIMIKYKIWEPNRRRIEKIHKLRDRRECFGEMGQMDGSYHDWFEGRAPKCCLLTLIDDATSNILALEFVLWESCFAYFNFFKKYILAEGRPISVYVDRHAVFETTRSTDKNYKNTQFHRAMEELDIELILTIQHRLKDELKDFIAHYKTVLSKKCV